MEMQQERLIDSKIIIVPNYEEDVLIGCTMSCGTSSNC